MSKRIEIDGEFYRKRRGKLVLIPKEWVGKISTPTTIRQRKTGAEVARKKRRALLRAERTEAFKLQL